MSMSVLQIPQLKSFSCQASEHLMEVILPEEFLDLCAENNPSDEQVLKDSFKRLLFERIGYMWDRPFRQQLVYETVPLLVNYSPKEKTFRLTSSKANRELFLVSKLEKLSNQLDETNKQQFLALQEHLEKTLALPVNEFPSVIDWA